MLTVPASPPRADFTFSEGKIEVSLPQHAIPLKPDLTSLPPLLQGEGSVNIKQESERMEDFVWKDEEERKLHIHKKGEVVYLTYPELDEIPMVLHGFSTRVGGVSKGICSSMNLSFGRGDEEEAVVGNFHRIADAVGFPYESIVCSDQTHTTNVREVTAKDRGKGITRFRDYTDVDGLITNDPDVTLATFYADCVPLFFVDPVHKAIGLSHSGWKGTANKIGQTTIEKMRETYGTDPKDIFAAIGPSICQDCYEISKEVAVKFEKELLIEKKNGKYQLDLWKANEKILLECKVPKEHIYLPNLCTCCNPELLFSHRASKGKRGNLAAFLKIKLD
jgi:polyphenol oxidase